MPPGGPPRACKGEIRKARTWWPLELHLCSLHKEARLLPGRTLCKFSLTRQMRAWNLKLMVSLSCGIGRTGGAFLEFFSLLSCEAPKDFLCLTRCDGRAGASAPCHLREGDPHSTPHPSTQHEMGPNSWALPFFSS